MSRIVITIQDVEGGGVEQAIVITDNDGHASPAVKYAYSLLEAGDRIMRDASYDVQAPTMLAVPQ